MSIFYFLYLLFLPTCFADAGSRVGVNYGRLADDLPPPPQVVQLLRNQGIERVKIFDTDAAVLTALANSGISVIVCLPNQQLSVAAASQSFTDQWVQANITKYYPATKIEAIAAGNEVFVDPTNITKFLVPAMKNIYASLQKYKLDGSIKVSSPIAFSALASSYPTSSGSFKPELIDPVMKPMLEFFRQSKSYLMVNIYPFFAYSANSDKISLNYTLFMINPGVVDSGNGLKYFSLFEAQVDAVYAAMSVLKYDDIRLMVTETGWPSKGDKNELGATVENAGLYNGNLVRRVLTGGGTPFRPQYPLNVYLFALFNEYQKPGPTSERNYGLFYPNEQRVYNIPLTSDQVKNGPKASVKGSNNQVPPARGTLPAKGTPPASGMPPASGAPSSQGQTWCVANENVGGDKLQIALEYACGEGGVDCGPIQPGATCFKPNTIEAHASYAFNSYYQKNAHDAKSCNFDGAAYIVDQPPQYGECKYLTGFGSGMPPSSGTPPASGTPPTGEIPPSIGTPPATGTPSTEGQTWCVANVNAGEDKLQAGLEYACGAGGADCGPIQPGSTCYNPNTLEAHASYAFNSFYQMKAHADGSCDFNGAASVVDQPPQYGDCVFPTGSDSGTPPSSATPPASATPPGSGTPPDSGTSPSNGAPPASGLPPATGTPSTQGQTWCVANVNSGEDKLQAGLEYACGAGGADCGSIQPGSTCYNPNTLEAHASYAFNSFYQMKAHADGSCDFNGAASVVDQPPQYGDCVFPTSATPPASGTSPSNGVPPATGSPPATGTPSTQGQTWCVANVNAGEDKLQAGLEYACGAGGADCGPIQPGSTCYNPNTLEAHASYAFNSFYQMKAHTDGSCDFNGAASIVDQPPQYGECEFPTGSDSGTPPNSGTSPATGMPPNSGTSTATGTLPTTGTSPATGTPSTQGQTWCVANGDAGEDKLQSGLEYACGAGGADCGPIQPGSTCYNPNILEAHASYAFNSYYQKKGRANGSCDFGGAASVVDQPPQYGDCQFPTS